MAHKILKYSAAILTGVLLFSLTACQNPQDIKNSQNNSEDSENPEIRQFVAMDTSIALRIYGSDDIKSKTADAAQDCLQKLELELSRTQETSSVSQINQANGEPVLLEGCLPDLLSIAKDYQAFTGGAFDITIAPVADAWGFTKDHQQVPDPEELTAALALVNSDAIQITSPQNQTQDGVLVRLNPGQEIDLGGLAKGYASDRLEGLLAENQIPQAIVDLGGNIYVRGSRPDGDPWRVAIRDPQDENAAAVILSLQDSFAITSGGYERYFIQDGKRYHHILDPATGYPSDSGLLSVTVVSDANGWTEQNITNITPGAGTMCDILSTALFVMGEARALDFWRSHDLSFDLVLITEDNRVILTDGLADRYQIASRESAYKYEVVS